MAAVPSTSSTPQIETEFDYEGVKKKYMCQIELYYLNRKLHTNAPWTRNMVEQIKSTIKEGIRLRQMGRYPSKFPKYKVMDKYEIYTDNGEEKLIYKRANPNSPIIQIVGAEDCFDLIVDAHMKTAHGGYEKITRILRANYSIPKTSIDFLIASCNVCLTNNSYRSKRNADNRIPQVFHARGQVSLINMTLEPDHEFRYILFYLDRFTKYMLLRPLVTNHVKEAAMELMKIFLDIGPPEKLETYDRVYFKKVLKLITTAHGRFHGISLMLPVKLPEVSANDIKNMLKKWQQQSGARNWAMGCYVVQWESNCTVTGDGKSPYQTVFNMKPWYSLHSRNKTLHRRDDSNNNDSSHSNDCDSINIESNVLDDGDILIPSDSEVSNTSEVAEITEENGDVIATIPLKPLNETETSTSQTDKPITPVNIHTFSTKDVIIEQPLKVVGNLIPGKSVQPEYTQDLDNIPVSMIMKPEILEKLKCHVCKTLIVKPYTCVECNRSVHLFCSDRLMKQDVPLTVLNVTCTPCTILAKRNERIEQKSKEIDNDNGKADGSEMLSKRKKIE